MFVFILVSSSFRSGCKLVESEFVEAIQTTEKHRNKISLKPSFAELKKTNNYTLTYSQENL